MLAAGLLTPLASMMLSSVMITAIRKVHGRKGVWNTNGGYEYNAVLLAALFAITEQGPGRYSIDARAFPRLRGARLAVAQLAFALAGSGIATSEPVQADPEEPEALSGDITGDGIPARGRVPAPA
jgi:putative oxidoreductase